MDLVSAAIILIVVIVILFLYSLYSNSKVKKGRRKS